jgi:hypothetical protein
MQRRAATLFVRALSALNEGADIETRLVRDLTPLMLAAEHGHAEMVDALLARGADVDAEMHEEDGVPRRALHCAVYYGQNVGVVRALLARGADVQAGSVEGVFTPLHMAAQGGDVELVQLLLSFGADVHARGPSRFTPLHVAAQHGHARVVDALVAHGADVFARTENANLAIGLPLENPALITALAEHSLNPAHATLAAHSKAAALAALRAAAAAARGGAGGLELSADAEQLARLLLDSGAGDALFARELLARPQVTLSGQQLLAVARQWRVQDVLQAVAPLLAPQLALPSVVAPSSWAIWDAHGNAPGMGALSCQLGAALLLVPALLLRRRAWRRAATRARHGGAGRRRLGGAARASSGVRADATPLLLCFLAAGCVAAVWHLHRGLGCAVILCFTTTVIIIIIFFSTGADQSHAAPPPPPLPPAQPQPPAASTGRGAAGRPRRKAAARSAAPQPSPPQQPRPSRKKAVPSLPAAPPAARSSRHCGAAQPAVPMPAADVATAAGEPRADEGGAHAGSDAAPLHAAKPPAPPSAAKAAAPSAAKAAAPAAASAAS